MARKQKELPGMESKTQPEIDAAAEAYQDVKLKRMDLTREEKLKKDALVYVMKKHNLEVYKDRSSGLVVHLKPGRDGVQVSELLDDDEKKEAKEEKEATGTATTRRTGKKEKANGATHPASTNGTAA